METGDDLQKERGIRCPQLQEGHDPPSSIPVQHKGYFHARHYEMLIDGDIKSLAEEMSSNPGFVLSDLVWEPDNNTALHIAACSGQLNLVVSIVEHDKGLVNYRNSEGDLPIHAAVRAGQVFVVRKLLQLGGDAQVERVNNDKNTVLHIALENEHLDLATFLFQKCPPTFYRLNAQGISPLYLAIKAAFLGLVVDMLQAGAAQPHLVEDALRETTYSVLHAAITRCFRYSLLDPCSDPFGSLNFDLASSLKGGGRNLGLP